MALVYSKQVDGKTSFALWKIEETADELYRQLQLDSHEKAYLETLNKGKRNLHWLGTRVLLRKMLNTDFYIDMEADEHGKPFIKNSHHHISLSHSYEYAAVMISEDKAVGIDIEIIKDKIERVAKKFLSGREIDFIDKKNKIEHLYICWCAKEAVYKLQGKRNVSFLHNIRLYPFVCCERGKITAKLIAEGAEKTFIVHYEKYENYMIGYVADGGKCEK